MSAGALKACAPSIELPTDRLLVRLEQCASRNGQTSGTITAGPPGPGSFSCPPGQTMYLVAVSYSGLNLTGENGDTIHPTPDPVSLSGLMIKIQ
ncbi:hypothetical protein KGA66_00140 [Actinocrinis puniceicyclus]|uniref:Uncharacterized protein n=1 Tax=Actinocrinis puniceicyclus TaxID=977794 RepID=A0A8J8B944_9ACTN|nr:hypothetical protein [Actinocrinis puniceicyclus]MBS2961432.1 hypothetical protein [Actinocrinis puniceicyclus]